VQALKKADVRQRKTLEANYGQWDEKKVKKVRSERREGVGGAEDEGSASSEAIFL
jgi:hypothetical protein